MAINKVHARAYALPTTPKAAREGKGVATPSAPKEKFALSAKITLLRLENPKRRGSLAEQHYKLYASSHVVSDYLGLGGTQAELANDVKHGFIEVAS